MALTPCNNYPADDTLEVGDLIHYKKVFNSPPSVRLGGAETYTLSYLSPEVAVVHCESASGRDLGDTAYFRAEFDERFEKCRCRRDSL